MHLPTFKKLHAEGLISDAALHQAETRDRQRMFSLHWELRLLLYLGVLLLTGGLGILVYKNIDTIGHQAVLAVIALVTAGSFFYCFRKKAPFTWGKVAVADPFFDYVLLLGCLSLLIFLAYIQYQYDLFEDHYGSATFIPMVILFIAAYYFDHLGVLSLAITNFGAWAGIAITPLAILKDGNFSNSHLIFTGIILGGLLLAVGRLSSQRQLKPHFETTYTNFGLHLFFVAALAGLFTYDQVYFLWFLPLMGIAWFLYTRALKRKSFYLVVVIVLYAYIALCYMIVRLLLGMSGADLAPIALGLLYFILSAIGVAVLLIRLNRQLRSDDRI